jgi:hypothetical protein
VSLHFRSVLLRASINFTYYFYIFIYNSFDRLHRYCLYILVISFDKISKQDRELELSQDTVENLGTVDSLRVVKRPVENQEGFGHNGQGGSNKIPKLVSKAGISEKQVSEDSSREILLKGYVQSVREADWNKVKELSENFSTAGDSCNQIRLLSASYSHVRSNCGRTSDIYWKKPTFAHVTYSTFGRTNQHPNLNKKRDNEEKSEKSA